MCIFCGRDGCPTDRMLQEVEPHEALNLIQAILGSRGVLGGRGDPRDPLGQFLGLSGAMPPGLEIPGLLPGGVDQTLIGIGPEGQVMRFRHGTKTETMLLKDVTGVNPDVLASVVAAFQEYGELSEGIRNRRKEAARLREQALAIEKDVQGRRVDLKFAIWAILPDEMYGREGLELDEERKEIVLIDTHRGDDGEDNAVLEEEAGRGLLETQEQIKADEQKARDNRREANRLEQEARSLPELLKRKQELATELFDRHVFEQLKSDGDDIVRLLADLNLKTNEPEVHIERLIKEQGEELPAEEHELLKAFVQMKVARDGDNFAELPNPMRELLGLPMVEAPQLEQQTDEPADEAEADEEPEQTPEAVMMAEASAKDAPPEGESAEESDEESPRDKRGGA